jgi:ribonuclease R
LVALLSAQGKFLVGEPFFPVSGPRGGSSERIVVERDKNAAPGRLVLLQPASRGRAQVLRVLGKPDVARDVVEAMMYDRGLQRRFPPGVERAAQDAAEGVAAADPAGSNRRDLRDLPTFTIDPTTAKDFDDAISAERQPDGHVRIWVHIADVSAYVRPGSAVDREAFARGTSVYVPGAVEPMLPETLSNGACSLVPDEDRLAVTVQLDYGGADVVKVSFHRTIIRSNARLTYEDVDAVFAGEREAQEPWATPLALARDVAALLQERREGQGAALAIETTEPEFRFDRRGHVSSVAGSIQTESHRLIEHLMIAANEQVAKTLSEHEIPALYRVHERPEPESAERLVGQLASLGVPTPPVPEQLTSTQAGEVVGACSRAVDEHVRRVGHGRAALTTLVLRSLKQARYDADSLGHAGLGLTHYCHFTSPIRRYPDLICHRALLSLIGAGEDAPRAGAMEESGVALSARERDAMVIERDADDVVRCFVLEKELFEQGWDTVFDGEVTGLISAGAFVAFGETGTDGMLPVRRLSGDWYELNEESTILRGERTGTTIRLGDPIRVTVGRVDVPRGRVDLNMADDAESEDAVHEIPKAKNRKPKADAPTGRAPKPAKGATGRKTAKTKAAKTTAKRVRTDRPQDQDRKRRRDAAAGDDRPPKKPRARPATDAARPEKPRRGAAQRADTAEAKAAEGEATKPERRRRKPSDPDWEPARPKVRKGRKSKSKAKAEAAEKARKEDRDEYKRSTKRKKRSR